MRATQALIFTTLLLAACQGQALDFQLPSQYVIVAKQAICEQEARCGDIGRSELFDCQSDAAAETSVYPSGYDVDQAVRADRVIFNLVTARECVLAIKSCGCTTEQFDQVWTGVCNPRRIYEGNTWAGMPCQNSIECGTGYCGVNGRPLFGGCSGTCQSYLSVNMPCDPRFSQCYPSLYCDSSTLSCTAKRSEGESCRGNEACGIGFLCKKYLPAAAGNPETLGNCRRPGKTGEECEVSYNLDFDCVPGLRCDTAQSSARCAERKPQGEACNATYECQDGLACAGGRRQLGAQVSPGRCVPFLDRYADCTGSDFLYSQGGFSMGAERSACPKDMYCPTISGPVCELRAPGGGTCFADTSQPEAVDFFSCRGLFYCDRATEACQPQIPLGASCDQSLSLDNVCAAGACDSVTSTCQLLCR